MKCGSRRPNDKLPSQPWNKPRYGLGEGKWPVDVVEQTRRPYLLLRNEFDVELPSANRCSWLREECAMPAGWGRHLVARLIGVRRRRIREWCNRGKDI